MGSKVVGTLENISEEDKFSLEEIFKESEIIVGIVNIRLNCIYGEVNRPYCYTIKQNSCLVKTYL